MTFAVPARRLSYPAGGQDSLTGVAGIDCEFPRYSTRLRELMKGELLLVSRVQDAWALWHNLRKTLPDQQEFAELTDLISTSTRLNGARYGAEVVWSMAFDSCTTVLARSYFLTGLVIEATTRWGRIPVWAEDELRSSTIAVTPIGHVASGLCASVKKDWPRIANSSLEKLPLPIQLHALAVLLRGCALDRLNEQLRARELLDSEISHWGSHMLSALAELQHRLPHLELSPKVWLALLQSRSEKRSLRQSSARWLVLLVVTLPLLWAGLNFAREPVEQVGPGEWVVNSTSGGTWALFAAISSVLLLASWMWRRATRARRQRMHATASFVLGRIIELTPRRTGDDNYDEVNVDLANAGRVALRVDPQERWPLTVGTSLMVCVPASGDRTVA